MTLSEELFQKVLSNGTIGYYNQKTSSSSSYGCEHLM